MVHLGTHEHLFIKGVCRDSLEEMKGLVEGQVCHTFKGKISTTIVNPNKAFLAHHFFNGDGEEPMEILQGEKLDKVMDKFQPLYSPNI